MMLSELLPAPTSIRNLWSILSRPKILAKSEILMRMARTNNRNQAAVQNQSQCLMFKSQIFQRPLKSMVTVSGWGSWLPSLKDSRMERTSLGISLPDWQRMTPTIMSEWETDSWQSGRDKDITISQLATLRTTMLMLFKTSISVISMEFGLTSIIPTACHRREQWDSLSTEQLSLIEFNLMWLTQPLTTWDSSLEVGTKTDTQHSMVNSWKSSIAIKRVLLWTLLMNWMMCSDLKGSLRASGPNSWTPISFRILRMSSLIGVI
jgi:hypothetical protein